MRAGREINNSNKKEDKMSKSKYLYCNNTNQDVRMFHQVIAEAIENNGVFDEDYSDVFMLRKNTEGSHCAWVLEMAED